MLKSSIIKENPKIGDRKKRSLIVKLVSIVILIGIAVVLYNATTSIHGQPSIPASPQHLYDSFQAFTTKPKALLPLPSRNVIGSVLESDGALNGLEVGVHKGEFTQKLLTRWESCENYIVVDTGDDDIEETLETDEKPPTTAESFEMFQQWEDKIDLWTTTTEEASSRIDDSSMDFIYLDAHHNYCQASEDLELFWPKLKRGGIFSGLYYMYNSEVQLYNPGEDWGICPGGIRNDRCIRGAVEDFAEKYGLVVTLTFRDSNRSWMIRKP